MFTFDANLLRFQNHHLLVYGPEAPALGEPLAGPTLQLAPGYRTLTGTEYLLPTEVIDDIGQRYSAPECYDWIETRGDRYPRADLVGVTLSGEARSKFMKEMDLIDLAVFARAAPGSAWHRVSLAVEASAVPDDYALVPVEFPFVALSRALPTYRLAPGVFGALGAALITQLLASGRYDWRLTYDQIDDLTGGMD